MVTVARTLSEWFRVKKGVRQGCVMYLLNILAEMVMRETLDAFQGGLPIGGRMITSLRYADDIILLATSETELQELVDRVSRKYSLLDKTNSNGERQHSAPHIHSPTMNYWSRWIRSRTLGPWLQKMVSVRRNSVRTRLNRGQAIGASLQKTWKSHIPISTKIRLMKALVWPIATYSCESWSLRKKEETRLDTFDMKGLRKMDSKENKWMGS